MMYLSKKKKLENNVHHENTFLWKQNLQMCLNEWSRKKCQTQQQTITVSIKEFEET